MLHHIFNTLEQQTELKISSKIPISTTLGGLKDGAAKEIEQQLKKEALNVKDNTDERATSAQTDKDFARPLRQYYQKIAKSEGAQYLEDETATSYRSTLKRPNGEKLQIQASNANNIGLTAQDKQGKKKIPDYADFNKLVLYAKERGQTISFGNIKSAEFKARLLLACLENDVPLVKKPQLDMEKIDKETSLRLKKAQYHQKGNQPTHLEGNTAPQQELLKRFQEQKLRA